MSIRGVVVLILLSEQVVVAGAVLAAGATLLMKNFQSHIRLLLSTTMHWLHKGLALLLMTSVKHFFFYYLYVGMSKLCIIKGSFET